MIIIHLHKESFQQASRKGQTSIFISDFKIPKDQEVAFYGDNSAFIVIRKILNTFIKRMKNEIPEGKKYFDKWKIKVNQEKTQVILFPFNKSK